MDASGGATVLLDASRESSYDAFLDARRGAPRFLGARRGAPRSPQAPAPADQPPVEPVGYPKAFEGFPDEIAANKAFATGLVALQQKIMARNKARHAGDGVPPALARAYNCFDVNFVESSIAI